MPPLICAKPLTIFRNQKEEPAKVCNCYAGNSASNTIFKSSCRACD